MLTRTNRWMTLAAVLLGITCSTDLTHAGNHGSGGDHMSGGNSNRSKLGTTMFRNNSLKYSSNNNNNNSSSKKYVYKQNHSHSVPITVWNNQQGTPNIVGTVQTDHNNGSNHKKLDGYFNNLQFHSSQSPHNSGIQGSNLGLNSKHISGKIHGVTGTNNWKPVPIGQGISPTNMHVHDHHHHNWCWVGFATPWVYGVNNYRNGGYYTPTVINNTTVIEQPVVQTSATVPVTSTLATGVTASAGKALDLTLKNISLLDAGSIAAGVGPTYRVVIGNTSTVNVEQPFTVTVIAAKADRSFDDNTPRIDESIEALPAGKDTTLDIRLPVAALTSEKDAEGNEAPFSTLLVVIDGFAKLTEANRDNNAAAIPRTQVEVSLPTVTSAITVAAAGNRELSIAGQSFGNEPGKLMIDLGTVRVPAEVVSWEANSIKAKLPNIETAASVTTMLVVVRADGVDAEPFDLTAQEVAVK